MSHSLVKRVALIVAAAALATPAAQAGISRYDGYKSSSPQLHQVLSGAVRTPAVVATGSSGVDWRDAGLGALIGALGAGLLGSGALRLRRSRLPALR